MLVATFVNTGWVGKKITFEEKRFILEDHGPIPAGGALKYDREEHIEWADPALRDMVELLDAAKKPASASKSTGAPTAKTANRFEVGSFHSAHPMNTVMMLVCQGVREQLSSGDIVAPRPGVLESIYIRELSPSRLVVEAGNELQTYFSFTVELTADTGGTSGRAYCSPPFSKIPRWPFNVQKLAAGVETVMTSASATVNRWDVTGKGDLS